MARFRRYYDDLRLGSLDFRPLERGLVASHMSRHGDDPEVRKGRFNVNKVETEFGDFNLEIGELEDNIYVELKNDTYDEDDPRFETVMDRRIEPLLDRTLQMNQAAREYVERLKRTSSERDLPLKALAAAELEATSQREQITEDTEMERVFSSYMFGDESSDISPEYDDVMEHFHVYRDQALRIMNEQETPVGDLWLNYAS